MGTWIVLIVMYLMPIGYRRKFARCICSSRLLCWAHPENLSPSRESVMRCWWINMKYAYETGDPSFIRLDARSVCVGELHYRLRKFLVLWASEASHARRTWVRRTVHDSFWRVTSRVTRHWSHRLLMRPLPNAITGTRWQFATGFSHIWLLYL